MSNPATYNINIYQGELFELSISATSDGVTPNDLSGYVAKSEIREAYSSSQTTLSFSVSSGLGPNGVISLSSSTASTVSLNPDKKYVWDLKIDSGTVVTPILKGNATVYPRVTK